MDPELIRTSLRRYDQYTKNTSGGAKLLATPVESTVTAESISHVNLKLCVYGELPESSIALRLIAAAIDHSSLTDEKVPKFLDDRCEESKIP